MKSKKVLSLNTSANGGIKMPIRPYRPLRWFTTFLMVLVVGVAVYAQATSSTLNATTNDTKSKADQSSTFTTLAFLPQYTWQSTTGNAMRVAQYNDLRNSAGGIFTFNLFNKPKGVSWTFRSNVLTKDDYRLNSTLRLGEFITLKLDSRSLIHHQDKLLYGQDLTPDILVTDTLPATRIIGIQKTNTRINLRVRVPRTPITFFVKAGNQATRGTVPSRYYDMSSTTTCGESCHLHSGKRLVNYTYQTRGFGLTFRTKKVSVTYEHDISNSGNHLPAYTNYFGAVTSSPPDDLLPAGVPNTPAGYYAHDLMPGHRTTSDSVSIFTRFTSAMILNINATKGRTRDTTTDNAQNFLNANATFNINFTRKWWGRMSYHQHYALNDFWPSAYPLFPNVSYRSNWGDVRLGYRLNRHWNFQGYYKRNNMKRSNTELFPQFYSPDNLDRLHVVGTTFTNTLGTAATFRSTFWNLRSGYEWSSTRGPGYITSPGLSNRFYVDATYTPNVRFCVMNYASMTWLRQFPAVQRRNNLFTDTLSFMARPVQTWTLTLGCAYEKTSLHTDLIYGTDPWYVENLVPYSAATKNVTLTSNYKLTDRLSWNLSGGKTDTQGGFATREPNPFIAMVQFASSFSHVDIPQNYVRTSLTYNLMGNCEMGCRFQYSRYKDYVHPEFSGIFRIASVFIGRRW